MFNLRETMGYEDGGSGMRLDASVKIFFTDGHIENFEKIEHCGEVGKFIVLYHMNGRIDAIRSDLIERYVSETKK